jgi:phosphatidylglycerophosphatase A
MQHFLSTPLYVVLTCALALLSVWVHQVGDRILGEKDSRKLVLDELVGFMVAMTAVRPGWPLIALGFCLERALDIAKVFPADIAERKLPGGWGVVGDDVVAGLYTLAVLHLLCYLLPGLSGVG